jgi:hypothetical protein
MIKMALCADLQIADLRLNNGLVVGGRRLLAKSQIKGKQLPQSSRAIALQHSILMMLKV